MGKDKFYYWLIKKMPKKLKCLVAINEIAYSTSIDFEGYRVQVEPQKVIIFKHQIVVIKIPCQIIGNSKGRLTINLPKDIINEILILRILEKLNGLKEDDLLYLKIAKGSRTKGQNLFMANYGGFYKQSIRDGEK